MKRYFHIWMEGYHIQGGGPVGAHYVGVGYGENFKEACIAYYKQRPMEDGGNFNPENLSYWGCRLYPSEAEAKASFG